MNSSQPNNICIIPARGNSKRIPRKNIKDFLGKPIIAYSIEAAIQSGLFSTVMVSTDDHEIAEVAKEFGAEVPFLRSPVTSDDFSTLSDVIEEVKESYSQQQVEFDYICCVLATAPFVTPELLDQHYRLLIEKKYDSVRPVVRFSFPIQRAMRKNGDKVEMFNPQYLRTRSQDLEPAFHDAGMFYWMTYKSGLRGSNRGAIEVTESQAQDIDTVEDWELAQFKFIYLQNK